MSKELKLSLKLIHIYICSAIVIFILSAPSLTYIFALGFIGDNLFCAETCINSLLLETRQGTTRLEFLALKGFKLVDEFGLESWSSCGLFQDNLEFIILAI